jgi:hypothetical protein
MKILYFHAAPRSEGLDYLRAPQLVAELERRGHCLRFCWAVHGGQLANDPSGVNRDLLLPTAVREWGPNGLVFEDGLFVGAPRIPPDLLDGLEADGAVAIIAIPPHEYHSRRESYESFLTSRGIEVETAEHERPSCRSRSGAYLLTEVDVLRKYSAIKDDGVYQGVSTVVAASATPLRTWENVLLVGGDDVFVKAYGNRRIHMETHPIYGALVDRNFRTEAIFLAHVLFDSPECPNNATYFANLLEWLHQRRAVSLLKGAQIRG